MPTELDSLRLKAPHDYVKAQASVPKSKEKLMLRIKKKMPSEVKTRGHENHVPK